MFKIGAKMIGLTLDLIKGSFPRTVRVETTNHCNAACSFCPRESIGRDKGFMEQDLYEKIIAECARGGTRTLHLHNFGEPLMDKKLPERIALAKKSGISRVKIYCNGAFLKGKIAEGLIRSELDEIKVSIDGADAEEFNRIRIGLNHETTVQNARNFRKMRDEISTTGKPTIIATCSQTSNEEQTREMLRDVVDSVEFAHLHNWAGARAWLLGGKRIRKPCDRLWRTFTILVNGDVALCCLDYSGKVLLGNVRDSTIAEIWNNERYQQLRAQHRRSKQHRIEICKDCTKSYV